MIYLNPGVAPLLRPEGGWGLWWSLWVAAIPFMVIGAWMVAARLRDAGLPPWWVVFFFLPFANFLFFLGLACAPTQAVEASALNPAEGRMKGWKPRILAGLMGAVTFLGALALAVGVLRGYGLSLFVGAPFLAGFASSRFLLSMWPEARFRDLLASAGLAWLLSLLGLIGSSAEGLMCIAMATPILAFLWLMGLLLAWGIRKMYRIVMGRSLILVPVLMLLETGLPHPPAGRAVVSEVVIAAAPEVVWQHVVAFGELPQPSEWIFQAGVACPRRARIEGAGLGAVRFCEFTTGPFIEPVTVWAPGRELRFKVEAQPDVLREMTLWAGPRPPHLDGFLRCREGQFRLEALPGGGTRLIGTTWYDLDMGPTAYWGWWSDLFIHRIHLRVLDHVKRLSEESHA